MTTLASLRSLASIASIVALSACGDSGTGTSVRPAITLTSRYALTAGSYALPASNGFACTMTLPANNAASGATISVTMPPPGTQGITYVPVSTGIAGPSNTFTTGYPNPAQIVATTSAPVVFQGAPAATCAPIGSTGTAVGFIDPNDPGAIYGPTITVMTSPNGTSVLTVPAGVSFPIGSL